MRDRILILSVFVVASCGLAYELIAGALASYLLGDSILQFSSIIGCYLFAMGVGSHLARYVPDEDLLGRFVDIELLVGLFGGVAATLLFVLYAWDATPFRTVLYVLVFIIGCLVGMEIPLVMRIFNQRNTAFRELVSRVLTFDYLGALAVSLAFPLVLAPHLGLGRSGFLFGVLNAGVALWTLQTFRGEVHQLPLRRLRAVLVLGLLLGGFFLSERLTHWAEQSLFGDPIIHAETTPYQRLVLTRWKDDTRLYLNGNLQFSSRDEYRYHEALVLPLMENLPWARRVLVLGGGDGLAVRQLLKYPQLQITLVDLDAAMTGLFSRSPDLLALNQRALLHPRVKVINDDAGRWLEQSSEVFDAIIVDFPDPSSFGLGKLYSVPMYRLMSHHLSVNGLMVVQSTSPYFAPRSYWCIEATLRAAGLQTWPYHAYVPSFGEWGFIMAGPMTARFAPPGRYRVPTRFLNAESTRLMFSFPPDMPRWKVEPNQLNTQALVHYFEQDWRQVLR
ncbi:polyamine aminopropyltransferase [Leeia aquatica]|uniref:Polyamine aminopropyltransferase n=1 Tax=Leeia aquatica TaxID=2725557 RepID=A0A847S8J5_9NEIS|nr:polyamine aminopropyltransferase [Leeia aquatica]NLR76083.1 polyamine aminopropyltransferase [Leeia aquatica]